MRCWLFVGRGMSGMFTSVTCSCVVKADCMYMCILYCRTTPSRISLCKFLCLNWYGCVMTVTIWRICCRLRESTAILETLLCRCPRYSIRGWQLRLRRGARRCSSGASQGSVWPNAPRRTVSHSMQLSGQGRCQRYRTGAVVLIVWYDLDLKDKSSRLNE